MAIRVTMLGSGTSTGVPVINCPCKVCTSDDPRNRRWRPGLKLEIGSAVVLVDTPTDLREQALRFGVPRVDAVLFTHAHADHIFGLDDVRIFNFRQGRAIPCYGSDLTLQAIRRTFAYVFEETQAGGGKPQLDLIGIREPFRLLGREIVPVPVNGHVVARDDGPRPSSRGAPSLAALAARTLKSKSTTFQPVRTSGSSSRTRSENPARRSLSVGKGTAPSGHDHPSGVSSSTSDTPQP